MDRLLTQGFDYRGFVSLIGFKNDRALGLRALAVAANGSDVHSEFAAYVKHL